jgi:hypothetical protein
VKGRITGDGLADAAAAHEAMCQAKMPATRNLTEAELFVMAQRLDQIQREAAAQHGAMYRAATSEVEPIPEGRWTIAAAWALVALTAVGMAWLLVALATWFFA